MKILLVDDEQQILRGVSRLIGCERDEWEVTTSLSGEEALGILNHETFDVVVSDMRMPGMDGAQLLEEIGKRYPQILRLVLSGQADRETVLRAVRPMHQYLAKPCQPDSLIDAIDRAGIMQETILSSDALNAIGQANCMPTLPVIASEINQELNSDNYTFKSVAKIVSQDPVLSARILQLSNSAIFGQQNPVVDIEQGVSLIGTDMVCSLAMAFRSFFGTNTSARGPVGQSIV